MSVSPICGRHWRSPSSWNWHPAISPDVTRRSPMDFSTPAASRRRPQVAMRGVHHCEQHGIERLFAGPLLGDAVEALFWSGRWETAIGMLPADCTPKASLASAG